MDLMQRTLSKFLVLIGEVLNSHFVYKQYFIYLFLNANVQGFYREHLFM